MSRLVRLAIPLLVASLVPSEAGAQPETLELRGALPGDLDVRIDGQLSDLPWQVHRDPTPPAPVADLLAAGTARVVAWVEPGPAGALMLHLLDRRDRRVLSRAFDLPEGEAHPESTLHETVAVSLRSSVRALAAGGSIGVVVEPEPPAPPPSTPEPSAPEPSDAPVAAPAAPPATRWVALAGGGFVALDGASPAQLGPAGAVTLALGGWRVGLAAHFGLGAEAETAETRLRLTRHTTALEVGGAWTGRRLEAAAALRAGVALYRRETTGVVAPLVATAPQRTVAALVGVRATLRLALHENIAFRLDLGADGLVGRPRFQAAGEPGSTPWAVQPYGILALELRVVTRSRRSGPP